MRSILSLAVVATLFGVSDAQAFGKRGGKCHASGGCSSTAGCGSYTVSGCGSYGYSGGYSFVTPAGGCNTGGCVGNACTINGGAITVPQPIPLFTPVPQGNIQPQGNMQSGTLMIIDPANGQLRPATADEIRRAAEQPRRTDGK